MREVMDKRFLYRFYLTYTTGGFKTVERRGNSMEKGMVYLKEMFSLEGKVAVITGGGGVLAASMAETLLKAGACVSLWGRGIESLNSAKRSLGMRTGFNDNIHIVQVDTSEEKDVGSSFDRTCDERGMPDILINGVGGNRGKTDFIDTDIDLFESVLRLNLIAGLMVPTKLFSRKWIEKERPGSIINIASMGSFVPLSGVWAYDAAKSGVMNLTMACAKEFAPLIDDDTGNFTARGRAVIEHTPFGRFGNAEELAGTVLWLSSNRASGFVTGVTIPVDGGYLVHNI
jgi:NAD(P)-dependent dehydrogenase (short-subunit alcohol dehydrogenase family)